MKLTAKNIIIASLFCLILLPQTVSAGNLPVNAYLFYGDGCPHCAQERQFLFNDLKSEYSNLEIYEYEIYNNRNNILLLQQVSNELGVGVDGVPFLIIGAFAGEIEKYLSRSFAWMQYVNIIFGGVLVWFGALAFTQNLSVCREVLWSFPF